MLRPLHNQIVIRRKEAEEMSAGGIYIPPTAKETPYEGEVLAVGPGKFLKNGERLPMEVKVGDHVVFQSYASNETILDGEEVVVQSEDTILCVIESD